MRILLTHHFPLGDTAAGQLAARWGAALRAAGHETRMLIVADRRLDDDPSGIEAVVCRAGDATADLPFAMPRFSAQHERPAAAGPAFHELSDEQLTRYRDVLRRRLDAQIDAFDPHVVHAQHVWVQGQLALESGVPYILNAWGAELDDYALDDRYARLADQAAANAGRILVPDESVRHRVIEMFEVESDRVLVMPEALSRRATADDDASSVAAELARQYQAVVDERFGTTS